MQAEQACTGGGVSGMRVVSVINYKGGVGKTTLTANIGAELAFRGKKVLLIDLDPQASLTFSFVRPEHWQQNLEADKTIKKWYESFDSSPPLSLSSLIVRAPRVGDYRNGGLLRFIPSHLGLINVDLELATELGGASLKQSKINYLRVHRRLAEGLKEAAFSEFDVILIDCPPNFNVVTKNAIVASDSVLIPAKADYLSTLGIDYLRRSLSELVRDYNEYAQLESGGNEVRPINPEILGVVFTMMQFYDGQPISALRPYMRQTAAVGVPVFKTFVRESKTLFAGSPSSGLPLVLRDGKTTTEKKILKELEGLVSEFLLKLGA
ncbi:ParA family protein [Kitasatospora sp. A2-31]|uniref:ParA family protein n=1 Tax=Kitasatospora sp. A2-31 TaxID=2916414 RepID=UPI001EEA2D1F|nr:ParA family protein [Kitasatospora sp. A2-31]MCG6494814.1 AAA family ATPase [Kitasatospora sp. A2-31]